MKKSVWMLRGSIIALLFAGCAFGQTGKPGEVSAQYAVEPQFRPLHFGEVGPTGWILEQMRRDLDGGFAGHLPEVAPMTAKSDIFVKGRNAPDKQSQAGGQSGGVHWWNGETEGNWRSGNT